MNTSPVTYIQQPHADGLGKVWLSFVLDGPLDVEALVAALEWVVARHDALRLRLVRDDAGEPRQYAVPAEDEPPEIELQQVECESPEEFAEHVEAWLVEELATVWDLTDELPAKFFLFRFTSERHVLCAIFSRFAVDGRSQRMFAGELWAAYAHLQAGAQPSDKSTPGFLPAAARSMELHRKRATTTNVAYWRRLLAPVPAFRRLGELQQWAGDAESSVQDLRLAGEERARLREEAAAARCTEFEVLFARSAVVVAETVDIDRLVVLTLNDFRTVDDRDMLGAFARGIPVVLDRDPIDALSISPQQVQRAVLRARVHGYVPASVMSDCYLALEREQGLSVPGTVSFSYLDHTAVPSEPAQVADLSIRRGPGVPHGLLSAPMLDIIVNVQEAETYIRVVVNTGVFARELSDRVVDGLAESFGAEIVRERHVASRGG